MIKNVQKDVKMKYLIVRRIMYDQFRYDWG